MRVHVRLRGCPVSDVWYWDRRGLGSVYYLTDSVFAVRFSRRLASDPTPCRCRHAELQAQFGGSSREIKVALLDQTRLAGIGNLYASEILHRAGIHPQTRAANFPPRPGGRLHRALREVLLAAIRYEGSTLGDGTYRNALNRNGSYQNHHRVYKKDDCRCRPAAAVTVHGLCRRNDPLLCPVASTSDRAFFMPGLSIPVVLDRLTLVADLGECIDTQLQVESCAHFSVTRRSLASVLTPSGVIGRSETSSSAPRAI